jgi:hypothetical protein
VSVQFNLACFYWLILFIDRHDFGYQNYRKQSRFTESGKLAIDNNFLKE